MFSTPLQRALRRGLKSGNLSEELDQLGEYPVRSRRDARAICAALQELLGPSSAHARRWSSLDALAGLFLDVEGVDAPAFAMLLKSGIPLLIEHFEQALPLIEGGPDEENEATEDEPEDDEGGAVDDDPEDILLRVLKVLATYGSRAGAETIVAAARIPLSPETYWWHPVLQAFSAGHPQAAYLFGELTNPPPPGFLGVAVLDSANAAAEAGHLQVHPFDSSVGCARLQAWLEDPCPAHFSYAHSATGALRFLGEPQRTDLLRRAQNHSDPGVQLEAARAAAKLGRESGLQVLVRLCLKLGQSERARHVLEELGRVDLVPAEAQDPAFQAKAEFAAWLAHPNELGKLPDELEIIDQRELAWPPEYASKTFWLIRFLSRDESGLEKDDEGCGLVGGVTWSFLSSRMHRRPPEDVYAIHCYWEQQHEKLIEETRITDPAPYESLWDQWHGAAFQESEIEKVATFSHRLRYPARRVALARAVLDGAEGWVVLDGPHTRWYSAAEMPPGTGDTVLKIHVGRQLLGFGVHEHREPYAPEAPPKRDPQQTIAAYERLFNEAVQADGSRKALLLGMNDLLSRHFESYVDALAAVRGEDRAQTLVEVYDRFLQLADLSQPPSEDLHDGVLLSHFSDYVDALLALGRTAEIEGLIASLEPHWDHNWGYGHLGTAAFKIGRRDLAEHLFLKLKSGLEDWRRSEELMLLFQIWHEAGQVAGARQLLLDALRAFVTEIQRSEYPTDRRKQANEFARRRAVYCQTFPDGEAELERLGIPIDLLERGT